MWEPAWVEQQLVRTGRLHGPVLGAQRDEVISQARQVVIDSDLPLSTPRSRPQWRMPSATSAVIN